MKLNKISKSFFINLDRRTDRLDHIYKNTPFFTERFPAVDSKSLELTEDIKKLFPNDLYLKKKKSEIACCLSHYKLWKQLVEDKDADNYLILEDDVVFEKGFVAFWNNVWSHSMPSDYFLIYLGGCQPYNKPSYHKALQPYNKHFNNVKKQDFFTKNDHYWHMNASSYVISKQCASLMCQWVEQKGFDGVLDFFMINFVNKNKLFSAPNKLLHLNPLMTRQLHEENDNIELDKNSDIRFDQDKFTKETIPKKIIQTWKSKNLDTTLTYLTNSVKMQNPSFDYQLYDDQECRNFIQAEYSSQTLECYDKLERGSFKADLWRYCMLYKYGGIYCDIDMICLGKFDSLIGDADFFTPVEIQRGDNDYHLFNAFIGVLPQHPIMKNCIDIVLDNILNQTWIKSLHKNVNDIKKLTNQLNLCGPGVLGVAVNRFLGRPDQTPFHANDKLPSRIHILDFDSNGKFIKDIKGNHLFQNKSGNPELLTTLQKSYADYEIATNGFLTLSNTNDSIVNLTADNKIKQNEFIKLKNEWAKFKDYNFLDFVAKNLPNRDVPKEKYTCYNPGRKIGIVSLYTPDISEYAIESEISIRDYAFKQGYTFHVYRDKLDQESHANWSKPQAILNHFDDHEVIIWMDSDTIIFNDNQKFEDILTRCVPVKKIIACEDIGANCKPEPQGSLLNTGVLLFRTHQYAKNLIQKWRDFNGDKSDLYSSGGDQEVFCKILKSSDGFGFNRKIFPMNMFNTDPRKVDKDTFILHFMAYGNTLKSVFMRYWGSK